MSQECEEIKTIEQWRWSEMQGLELFLPRYCYCYCYCYCYSYYYYYYNHLAGKEEEDGWL
ncbi:unnamed protein product [Coffea canephora]|uniref:Uncharacterized protein n=1 Tax=Coffea canephora TaxID=49390 RepID=A0A068UE86_COFCA|nr:unnamed protein product [Coffea canephora]